MKKRRGNPCKHRYSGTCKSLDKVQTSSAHAVEEWTPCCHRLLVDFSEFAGSEYRRSVR